MAAFPALEPLGRSWSLGQYPVTQQPAWGVTPIRFRHSTVATASTLSLQYEHLTDAEAAQIREHYRQQRGGLLAFPLPSVVFNGAATLWRYAAAPEETHRRGSLVDVTVELESTR